MILYVCGIPRVQLIPGEKRSLPWIEIRRICDDELQAVGLESFASPKLNQRMLSLYNPNKIT